MVSGPRITKPTNAEKDRTMPTSPTDMKRPEPLSFVYAELLEDLIEHYFEHQLSHGIITKTTHRNYRIHMRPFVAWWQEFGPPNQYRLTRQLLQDSLEWIESEYRSLKGEPLARTTIEDCYARVRSVFHWLYRNNCTGSVNIAEWCPRLVRSQPKLYFPTIAEMQTLLSQPAGDYRLRDTAIMAFLLSTGARLFESAAVTRDCVQFDTPVTCLDVDKNHGGYCHLPKTKFDNLGHRGGRHVVFCTKTGLLLKAYLRSVDRQPGDSLFDISDSGISQVIKRYTRQAGLDEISPHAFRRCFSDHWQDTHRREHVLMLKYQLGHSTGTNDVTESRYTNRDNPMRKVRDIQERYVSPLDQIDIPWDRYPVHVP
jgi:integrase